MRLTRDSTYFSEMLEMKEKIRREWDGFDAQAYISRLEPVLRDYLDNCRASGDTEALAANLPVRRRLLPWHRRLRHMTRVTRERIVRQLKVR